MEAIAYVRFSSEGQADGSSIERQTATIEAYCKAHRLDLVDTIIDDGFSASKGHHLSHGRFGRVILANAKAGKYRGMVLVAEDLDRLSRLGIDKTNDLIRELLRGGMEIHLTMENRVIRDLDDLTTVILNAVKNYGAKEFSAKLSERIGKAWAKKHKNAVDGKPITRQTPDWIRIEGRVYVGSTITDPGHFVLIPERVKAVKKAFRLAALGIGAKHIANQLNGQGRSLRWITRTLSNREVLGEYTPKGCDPIPNYFPPIITQTEFDAVRALVARKRRGGKTVSGNRCSDRADNLFSGLLFDVTEPEPVGLHFQRVATGSAYLRSDFRAGQKQHACRYDKLEKVLLDFLAQQVDWEAVAGNAESEEVKAAASRLDKVLAELDRTNRLIEKKTALMDDPELDAATLKVFASQIAKAQAKLEELEEQKETLSAKVQAAQAKTAPLYDSVRLIDLIEQNKTMLDVVSEGRADVNDIRLRLRTEIRQRFERIEVDFSGKIFPAVVNVVFVNGARLNGVVAFA